MPSKWTDGAAEDAQRAGGLGGRRAVVDGDVGWSRWIGWGFGGWGAIVKGPFSIGDTYVSVT